MTAPWLQTLGSGRLDLVNPRPEQINPRHVVKVLARIPRFGGHTEGMTHDIYSVLQHSHEGALAIMRDTGRKDAADAFRWHDAHEFAIGDRATPVAEAHAAMANLVCAENQEANPNGWDGYVVKRSWQALKSRLDAAIYARVGIAYPLPADVANIVHEYDLRMCRTERDARLGAPPAAWADAIEDAEPVRGCDLSPWSPGTVEKLFWNAVDNPHL